MSNSEYQGNKYDDSSDNMFLAPTPMVLHSQQIDILENQAKLERIRNQFTLHAEDQKILSKYYVLRWEGTYLISQLKPYHGYYAADLQLIHQDILYKVNFLHCSPWKLVADQKEQFYVSFRLQVGAKEGIVIIKKAT